MIPNSRPATPKWKTWRWWLKLAGWFFGILFAIDLVIFFGVRGYAGSHGGSEGVQVIAKMKILEVRLQVYKWLHGSYPTEEQGLESILKNDSPTGDAEHVAETLRDPWHRKLQYRCPGTHNKTSYDLYSLGPDGIEGTEDDITNW
jgi:general secretion pathway protein G